MSNTSIISKLNPKRISPGEGYYQVFILDDCVVKKYKTDYWFEHDIRIHEELDGKGVIPKMLSNFTDGENYYLVVEKVVCLDKEIRETVGYNFSYFDNLKKIERTESHAEKLADLVNRLAELNYRLDDEHAGNLGYYVNDPDKLVCLDEGCFVRDLYLTKV